MRKAKYWIIFFVFLLSQVLTGAALAETPAQEITPEEEKLIEPAVDAAGTDVVSYNYAFSHTMGTFTPITGGTVHGTNSNDDTSFAAIDIGFTFKFDGVDYTQVSIQSNGFIAMGSLVYNSYTPLSTGSSNNVVAALGRDIQGNATTSELMSLMEGTEPNRIFTVQWSHYKRYGTSYAGDDFNFQIKLYETSQKIEFVYGQFTAVYNATPPTVQVGLRGASNADFNNRTTATDWTATTAGATNTASMALTDLVYPPSGLTYHWVYSITPVSDPDFTTDPVIGWKDYPVTFTASVGAGSPPIQYDWDFGDVTTGTGQVVDHTYADVGTYTVTLTVSNNGGEYTASITHDVEVDVPPVISIYPNWLDAIQPKDSITTQTFNICNIGGADLTWELSEALPQPPAAAPANPVPEAVVVTSGRATISETGIASGTAVIGEASGGIKPEDVGDAWETMAPLPEGRVFNAVIADGAYVYVIGGTSDAGGLTPTATNYRYNTASNVWETMAAMPAPLDSIDGAVIDNKVYIPGSDPDSNTYVYDIATDTWATIATNGGYAAPVQYQVVAIGTDLYVLGGIISNASTTAVWKLDTVAETWTAGVPMQKSRTSFSAAAINGEIYVAGGVLYPGFTPDMTAEKFDGTAWSYIAAVPNGGGAYTRWSYNADGSDGSNLWLAAGRRDADWNVLNHAGFYDPATDSWTDSPTIPVLNQGRVYMEGDVADDGYFYVIGGRDAAGAIVYSTNERLRVVTIDIPWASEDPLSGTLASGTCETVTVTFDSTGLAIGDYFGDLKIMSNDPTNPFEIVYLWLSVWHGLFLPLIAK